MRAPSVALALTALVGAFALAQDPPDEPAPDDTSESGPVDTGPDDPPFPPDDTGDLEGGCAVRDWGGDWPVALLAETNPQGAAAIDAQAFPELTVEQEAERVGSRPSGLVVVQGGRIIYERYARGYTAETPHLTWSVSKTFTNALVGIAVGEGALALDDSICDHVDVGNLENCAITVQDLLEFSSGVEWRETYEGAPPTTSSVIAMLYGEGVGDMAGFVASQGRRQAPGDAWQYSSGDSTLLAGVVGAALEPAHGRDFAWATLFDPLGMGSVTWERDGAGTLVGSSYVYATPRDQARFGQMLLDDGCWQGERILPEGWVADSTQISEPIKKLALDWGEMAQGRQIWLNQGVVEQGTRRPWPGAPPDTFAAQGHWKQRIIMIPSRDLVVVRTGDDRDGSFDTSAMLATILEAIGQPAAPLPPDEAPLPTGERGQTESLEFDMGLLGIATGYGSKMACSCAFVMGRDDDYCREWVKASPDIVKVKFDREQKVVTARALGFAKRSARWVSERDGCVLE